MSTDQKIEEVLKLVREQGERTENRFVQSDTRFERLESRHDELLQFMREERALNNSRFTQLATGLMDVKKEVAQVRVELTAKIDKVYESLSQDIQAIVQDSEQIKRRVTKIEKHVF